MPIEQIVFYILLIDSLAANALAWFGREWYVHHFRMLSRWLPASKVWTGWYLILVIWIGFLVNVF